jgi:uncharacterized membrane protein HdeD (DUF308 family)
MAQNTPPSDIVRQASTPSFVWGVSPIIFGMLAVASPFFATVAVSVVIPWLIDSVPSSERFRFGRWQFR